MLLELCAWLVALRHKLLVSGLIVRRNQTATSASCYKSELTNQETKRLTKLEEIAEKLKRRENVQNRPLQTSLSEQE